MEKLIKWGLLGIAILSLILWLMIGDDVDANLSYTGALLMISYILLSVVVISIVIFAIVYLITHPKKVKKPLLTIALGIVLVLISFSLSDSTPVVDSTEQEASTVGAFLILFYILLVATLATMLAFGVKKVLKK